MENPACPEPDGAPDRRTAGAVSDFGRPYTALDSCETDITRVHTGIPSDPAACRIAQRVVVVWGLVSLVQLLQRLKVISEPAIAVASP
jgi:hypothetical protein